AARVAFVRLGRAFPPALPTLARVRLQPAEIHRREPGIAALAARPKKVRGRNGGKRRRSPRELALIEACRRLRPLEPICASTEINSSAVSPPSPTIGKGHPQAAQKPRWTASPSCLTR